VDRVSIVVGCCAGIDRRGDLSGCGIRAGLVMPRLLTARQQRCVAGRLPLAHERRPRSEDPTGFQPSRTRPLGIGGRSGGRAKHAAAPSCRCAPTSTARTTFAGATWLGSLIKRALVARRVEGGSSSRAPTPRCGTTRCSATGRSVCRVALFAIARSCRLRSGGSTPPGLRCTELRATSSTPTTRSRRPRTQSAEKSGETAGMTGPLESTARASQDGRRAGDGAHAGPRPRHSSSRRLWRSAA
jgi:hypothetical protein